MTGASAGGDRDQAFHSVTSSMKHAAKLYQELRGRMLVITNEIGELEAARCLGLELVAARDQGYDAVDGEGRKVCIRSRIVEDPRNPGPVCINGLRFSGPWDAIVLVLLDPKCELIEIHRAERSELEAAMRRSRNRKPSERPAFAISTFVQCGRKVWPAA
jgi:hypothetical protein